MSVFAESSSFAHPLRIEPASLYTKVRVGFLAEEGRDHNIYQRNRKANLEGEYNFMKYFSAKLASGYRRRELSNSETLNSFDRYMIAFKFGQEIRKKFVYGFGLKTYSRERRNPELRKDGVVSDYYLLRPNFSIGFKMAKFELMAEVHMQTETNAKFKESQNEEFRRHYQGGLALSYAITNSLRLFLEMEYREPYNKKIDLKTRFWNVYPGFSWQLYKKGLLYVSLQSSIKNERGIDRGGEMGFMHFFD